jgi:hypothetical protein
MATHEQQDERVVLLHVVLDGRDNLINLLRRVASRRRRALSLRM